MHREELEEVCEEVEEEECELQDEQVCQQVRMGRKAGEDVEEKEGQVRMTIED